MSKTNSSEIPNTSPEPATDAPPNCAVSTGSASVVSFRRRMDTDDLCCAELRGHSIDCTADWKRRGIWHCSVRNKAGELVADYRHEGHDRRAMLEGAARAAELLPND